MRTSGITISLAATLLSIVGACSTLSTLSVGPFARTIVPSEIAAPASHKLDLVVAATGVQIYRCDAKKDAPGALEWAFQAPEATLRDVGGRYIGKHYGGPTWEAEDGSKIVGTVDARRDAPEKSAIPWLRLKARSTGGPGTLANVTGVLRVSTSGGQPPAGGCNDTERGRIVRVGYTADYYFYVNR